MNCQDDAVNCLGDGTRQDHRANHHLVQLFDTSESLARAVSTFLHDGWRRGDHLLVIARAGNWARIAERLERRGCPLGLAIVAQRLTVLDAKAALAEIAPYGGVSRQRCLGYLDEVLAQAAARTARGVRVYDEIVELLAEEGDFRSALQVEHLWNEVARQRRFVLLCGYTAAHFADGRTDAALQAICAAHTQVQRSADDMLGNWLIERAPTESSTST